MERLIHIARMIYGCFLYYVLMLWAKTFIDWLFEKSLANIGYYAFIPTDENKWHELPYGAGGKKPKDSA
jgi:hypothetical protein